MVRTAFLLLALVAPGAAQAAKPINCHKIALKGELASGDRFEKPIGGGLVFRLDPERLGPDGKLNGWGITLVPSRGSDKDQIYPVTPPLRFNGTQTLGPSYGEDAKTSLQRPHEMRFLLNHRDYERIWPLLTNALWPYSAPHPDEADAEYTAALQQLTTGLLRLTVTDYTIDADTGAIQHISFRAEFTAPENFPFDPALKPKRGSCPAPAE
jgi:hypothetical protein